MINSIEIKIEYQGKLKSLIKIITHILNELEDYICIINLLKLMQYYV